MIGSTPACPIPRLIGSVETVGFAAVWFALLQERDLGEFVPNLYRVMASKPGYRESNWSTVKTAMVEPGKLDRLTTEIIAVAILAVMGCEC